MAHPSLLPALRRAADAGDALSGAAADEIVRLRAALVKGAYLAQSAVRAFERRDKPDWLDLNAAIHEFATAYNEARTHEQEMDGNGRA